MSAFIPTTRAARHARISEIIANNPVTSQAQLRKLLLAANINVTQATLSRDLEELRAYKEYSESGQRVYRVPDAADFVDSEYGAEAQLRRWTGELMISAEVANNQLVLRTPPGAAQLLASAVDRAVKPGVMGCIAGDDTVLVITKSDECAQQLLDELLELARGKKN
ncbi:MAG: arginine repressor [Trueperella sp.]|nr:arginine repressor [Trueperella sp.]